MASPQKPLATVTTPPNPLVPVSFHQVLSRLSEPGPRRLFAIWLMVCFATIPSGLLTRIMEWSSLPIRVGGVEVFVTIYLPLVACVPLVLWFGYLWGAIPAYFSTLGVAWLGGMPLGWALLFSFSNPLGLAALHLGARAAPMRTSLRSLPSFVYFILLVFISAIASSIGSFIWAHTNEVGVHRFYPMWQGWWLGGLLQGLLVVAPILMIATPSIARWRKHLDIQAEPEEDRGQQTLIASSVVMIATVTAFVLIVRWFNQGALRSFIERNPDIAPLEEELLNLFAGLSLPYWVMLTFVAVTLYFGYRVGLLWSEKYRELIGALQTTNQDLTGKTALLEEQNVELQRLAITDSLTQAHNRGYLMECLQREVSGSRRHHEPMSVLLLDLDRFKGVNDEFGHLVGDEILKQVADRVRTQLRREDIFARFGGEEFTIVLPRTDRDAAWIVAEKIRHAISVSPLEVESHKILLTVSLGVASLNEAGTVRPVRRLLALADRALYEAKRTGRNRTVAASSLERAPTPTKVHSPAS